MLPSAWGTLRCNAAGCLIVAGCYRLKEWKPELLDKVLFGKLTPLPMPSAAPALSLTSVGVSIGKGRGCQQINDSDRRSAGKLTSSFCGAISAFGATWCAPPGPQINIPAWVLCTSWGANFESRGGRSGDTAALFRGGARVTAAANIGLNTALSIGEMGAMSPSHYTMLHSPAPSCSKDKPRHTAVES